MQEFVRRLSVEFLYLDLDRCDRCQETEVSLEEALDEVENTLRSKGVELDVRKVHVRSEEQARRLGFASSPTVRVDGRDVQIEARESPCGTCGDLVGESVDCRVWVYRGKEYSALPSAMIVEAVLRAIHGQMQGTDKTAMEQRYELKSVPDNLKRFFAAKRSGYAPEDEWGPKGGDGRGPGILTECGCGEVCSAGSAAESIMAPIALASKRETHGDRKDEIGKMGATGAQTAQRSDCC